MRQKIILILIFLQLTCIGLYAQARKCEGKIGKFDGSGWRKSPNRKTEKITNGNFQSFNLLTGDYVGTSNGTVMELKLSCSVRPIKIKAGSTFMIPHGPDIGGGARPSHETAGGNRGSNDFILFPFQDGEPNLSVIRPESAQFWWGKPIGKHLILALSIQGSSLVLWSKHVDSEPRNYESKELRDKLRSIRSLHPGSQIKLEIKDAIGNPSTSIFRIFSLQEERNLQQKLNELKNETGIYGNLSRAEIYQDYRLYNLAAEEYEEALKKSRGDKYLLILTSLAQDDAGNLRRRDEINEILAKYSDKP